MATLDSITAIQNRLLSGLISINDSFSIIERGFKNLQNVANNLNGENLEGVTLEVQNISANLALLPIEKERLSNEARNGGDIWGGLKNGVGSIVKDCIWLKGLTAGFNFYKDVVSDSNAQFESERQITIVMTQGIEIENKVLQRLENFRAEQEKLGVISANTQMTRAQENAPIATLIPEMNNFAVNGMGVTTSEGDMVNDAKMFGEVMNGQINFLEQIDVFFSMAQERVLKYKTEMESGFILAEVVYNTVGNMNEKLAVIPLFKNENGITFERNDSVINRRFNYGETVASVYQNGEKFENLIENKVGGFFGGDTFSMEGLIPNYHILGFDEKLFEILQQTDDNAYYLANNTEKTTESLEYMRDIASQQVVNRYTTAQLKVDFKNTATINSIMDIDHVMNTFENKLREVINSSAEGVPQGV